MTSLTARLEETMRQQMEQRSVAGMTVALVKDGEVVFAKGHGVTSVDSGAPVEPDTRFEIMSVTKPLVVTAMMQLRDEGHFALDDSVNRHLAPVRIANDFEAESPVTIRQLMTHTSGLPVGVGVGLPTKLPLDQWVNTVARTTHRPGTEIVYANWAFDAMGVLIERFSGKPVDVYLDERIFQPLGMNATALAGPASGAPHASGHFLSAVDGCLHPLPPTEWPTMPPSPAGGCYSNVLDLAKFLIAHLEGTSPLTPSTAAEMRELHVRQGASETGMGLGFRVTRSNGRRLICHGGDGGGFTNFIGAYPDESVGVVVLINTGGMQVARSVIGNTALGMLAGRPQRRIFSGPTMAPSGLYESTFWDMVVEARGGDEPSLTATDGLVLSDHPAESSLSPIAEGALVANGGMFHGFEVSVDGDRFYGGVYPFTFVRQGEVPPPAQVDEAADLIGTWSGTTKTALGPLATTLQIKSESEATIDTPFKQGVAVSKFRAASGRVEGEFEMDVPGVGAMRMFLRLKATGARLTGRTHARSVFGETPMVTDLTRA